MATIPLDLVCNNCGTHRLMWPCEYREEPRNCECNAGETATVEIPPLVEIEV